MMISVQSAAKAGAALPHDHAVWGKAAVAMQAGTPAKLTPSDAHATVLTLCNRLKHNESLLPSASKEEASALTAAVSGLASISLPFGSSTVEYSTFHTDNSKQQGNYGRDRGRGSAVHGIIPPFSWFCFARVGIPIRHPCSRCSAHFPLSAPTSHR